MKVELNLDTLLLLKFEDSSDEELDDLLTLLKKWVDKVEDEIDYVNNVNDYDTDE
jgi:hypothetical protein